MRAMVLSAPGAPLQMQERVDPEPAEGEVRVKVSACGVCRTDLHVVDAELPNIKYPISATSPSSSELVAGRSASA